MEEKELKQYKDFKWIICDPRLLGGNLAIKGTRLSVGHILECLANGMTAKDIEESFDQPFPQEAMPEILKVAAELANDFHVAA